MANIMNFPLPLFLCSLVGLRLAAQVGTWFRSRKPLEQDEREDFNVIIGATLTLLGLLIGFSFSMAVTRYDQRKNYEEDEANAIGTEYLRVELLPAATADSVHTVMRNYLDQRILFYTARDEQQIARIDRDTAELQSELWSEVKAAAAIQPSPISALAVAGMNDVLNSQGYTQAAWWNRIPVAAWGLMAAIAVCCNVLIGYFSHKSGKLVLVILPIAISISFFLIADIDSPRTGLIHVVPQNLVSLSHSLHP
jgi:hypothetical protein